MPREARKIKQFTCACDRLVSCVCFASRSCTWPFAHLLVVFALLRQVIILHALTGALSLESLCNVGEVLGKLLNMIFHI